MKIYYHHHGEAQYFWRHLADAGLTGGSFAALANDGVAVAAADMPSYFPKDALGNAHLAALQWNSKLYIRTGLTDLRVQK